MDETTAAATRSDRDEYRRSMAEIDRLGDEIAVLSAQIQAATYELLVRLREFDQREGWFHHGAKSCAQWLAWRTSLDRGAARQWVARWSISPSSARRCARARSPTPRRAP